MSSLFKRKRDREREKTMEMTSVHHNYIFNFISHICYNCLSFCELGIANINSHAHRRIQTQHWMEKKAIFYFTCKVHKNCDI
jgi:hypothetical protein